MTEFEAAIDQFIADMTREGFSEREATIAAAIALEFTVHNAPTPYIAPVDALDVARAAMARTKDTGLP